MPPVGFFTTAFGSIDHELPAAYQGNLSLKGLNNSNNNSLHQQLQQHQQHQQQHFPTFGSADGIFQQQSSVTFPGSRVAMNIATAFQGGGAGGGGGGGASSSSSKVASSSNTISNGKPSPLTAFANEDTASLWAKIEKFHGPIELTKEEKTHKAARAVAEADAPKLEGDTVQLVDGALRAAAVKTASDCLDYAIALKKFGHNEAIRGDDMNLLAAKAGSCLESGSAYVRELAGEGKNFTFNGSLTDSQAAAQQESWDYAKKQCDAIGGHTENSHTLARKDIAPKTLSEVGSCLRAVGKAVHGTVVPKATETAEECMPVAAAFLPPSRSRKDSEGRHRKGPLKVTRRESCDFLIVC